MPRERSQCEEEKQKKWRASYNQKERGGKANK